MRLPTAERSQVLLRAGVFAAAVALERRRIARGSPRRVRRVDARTGAEPNLRQTIIVLGAQRATPWLLGKLIPGPDAEEQLSNVVDEKVKHQAATSWSVVVVSLSVTFAPSLKLIPSSTSATSSWPLNRRQRSWAASSSL